MVKEKAKKQKENSKKARQSGVVNYPVGDFLIQVKNAAMARNKKVEVRSTKLISQVAKVLKSLGFLDEIKESHGRLSLQLVYSKKEPIMLGLNLVSKPGLRIYEGVGELEKKRGPSTYIVSTPKGVMSSRDAIKNRLGGEVIAEIW